MHVVTEIAVEADRALVHEQGWQSWSPSTTYRLGQRPHRPVSEDSRLMRYRAESAPGTDVYWGEGLLAVDPGDGGPVTVVAAAHPTSTVPSIQAYAVDGRVVVAADGAVEVRTDAGPDGIAGALARWADDLARTLRLDAPRPAPTTWCSWYQYRTQVTESDVDDNIAAMDELGLSIEVVQIDDGYEAEIGDWLVPSGRFADLPGLCARIRDGGRRVGIWTAPFLVGPHSLLAAEHPEWLVRAADGSPVGVGNNWHQYPYALDVTHPGAEEYLRTVFGALASWGIDFHKIDFVYAAAAPGRRHDDVSGIEAYQRGLRLIRQAVGDEAYLLSCGAPQLPSIGYVDAMRVSPDTAVVYASHDGDLSQESQRGATLNGVSRAFQHGRFWVNDPDCIVARPQVQRRAEWAEHVATYGGLRGSSDGLRELDNWGLDTTRRLLSDPVPQYFVAS